MHTRLVPLVLVAAGLLAVWTVAPAAIHRMTVPTGPRDNPHGVDTIVVDPAVVRRTIPAGFFGINYSAFWDNAQGSAASARALAQTPIKTLRFPGGVVADWYDWQQPFYKGWSSTSARDAWRYARSFGATSIVFGTNYQGNLPHPPGQRYSVNSPQNAAAWVTANQTAGVPAAMEVGNEEDLALMHKADDPAFARYITAFNAQARAMHRANPHVRVLGPVGANEYYWWALDELGMFLQGAGNRTGTGQVDGISLHFYRGSTWYDAKDAAQYWLSAQGPWAAIQAAIRAHDTRALPVYITEWNLGPSDTNNSFTPTLGHALSIADLIGAFAQSGVASEDYWTTHSASGWGLLYGTGEQRPVDSPTPGYYAMALWGQMGRRLVALSQSADAANDLSAYATTGARGSVQVLAINKLGTPHTVRILLDGATPNGHRLRIYSLRGATDNVGDIDALYDGQRMPSPQQPLPGPRNAGVVHGNTLVYTVPGYSAVVLDLDGTAPAPRLTRAQLAAANSTTNPLPPLSVTAAGSVGQATIAAGAVQTLHMAARGNYDMGPVLVDLEVYDSASHKVFQDARTVDLNANSPITVTEPYTLDSDAIGGTYSFRVGVFAPNWKTSYAWSNAASFTVTGPPAPSLAVTGRVDTAALRPGATVTVTAIVSARHNGLHHALVDIEVYSPSGAKVCQPVTDDVNVPKDGSTTVTGRCAIPTGSPSGRYVVKAGVFGTNWTPLYVWNNAVATFNVQG